MVTLELLDSLVGWVIDKLKYFQIIKKLLTMLMITKELLIEPLQADYKVNQ